VLEVDVDTGATSAVAGSEDPAWVDWPPGLPARLDDGRLVWSETVEDTCVLLVDGSPVTPPGLQVRHVHHVGESVLFSASTEPTEVELWRWCPADGDVGGLARIGEGHGVVVAAAAGGGTLVTVSRSLDDASPRVRVEGSRGAVEVAGRAETPLVEPRVAVEHLGRRRLRGAVLLPAGHPPGRPLPVLMLPYGGPGAQRVLADRRMWLEAQWRADQGFAVVVADGRGTPGRGPAWARAVRGDLATPALEDQVDALAAAAAAHPELDLRRVGIYGWSFGGYLAALAVLRRPDVFHAAVAGAPVTDWRLYDTYYTERFLGDPRQDPGPYDRSSLLADAPGLRRPLLIVHGLVDDNVVVAHTLRLSQQLTEHGRSHAVLPLSGITHMAAREDVAEHLLTIQTRFLRDALGA
jgi:dipeptidyl-peptidase-4